LPTFFQINTQIITKYRLRYFGLAVLFVDGKDALPFLIQLQSLG